MRCEYYKQQILQFALQAKQLFEASPAIAFNDDYDKQMYIEFWEEYAQLLQKKLCLINNQHKRLKRTNLG